MSLRHTGLTGRLRHLLNDGKWHSLRSIIPQAQICVRPEMAVRQAVTKRDYGQRQFAGTVTTIRGALRVIRAEQRGSGLDTEYRLPASDVNGTWDQFLASECVFGDRLSIGGTKLWGAYQCWRRDQGLEPRWGGVYLSESLEKYGCSNIHKKNPEGNTLWKGLALAIDSKYRAGEGGYEDCPWRHPSKSSKA